MTYRIPRGDMTMISPEAAFNNHWEARIPVPIADIESDLSFAFHAGYAGLWPGMKVNVTSFDRIGTNWDTGQMQEEAAYRVIGKDGDHLYLARIGDIFSVAEEKVAEEAVEPYASYQVVETTNDGKTHFEVQDQEGNALEAFVDREQAEEFCERENSRGMGGAAGLTVKRGFRGQFKVEDSSGEVVAKGFPNKAAAEAFVRGGELTPA